MFDKWINHPTLTKNMIKARLPSCLLILVLLCSCATSNHGTFVTSTYVNEKDRASSEILGEVTGQSNQTWFLYLFPIGEPPSIHSAISDAKSKIEGTKFLVDLSFDDRTHWKFGHSKHVITVKAVAHK